MCVPSAELIHAVRTNDEAAALLGLQKGVRQEDGTRDEFERVFQASAAAPAVGAWHLRTTLAPCHYLDGVCMIPIGRQRA
jgi:hypothetical protein